MPTPRLRLGQLLVDARMISPEALDGVLAVQRTDGRRLGTLLVERGLINETQLTQILSHQLSVPWVSLLHIEFSRQLLNLVPRDVADRFCLVPIYVRHVRNQGDTLYVAMEDPTNEDGLAACREHAGLPVRSMIAPPSDIRSAIRVYYGVDSRPARSGRPAETVPTAPPPPPSEPPVASESAAALAEAPVPSADRVERVMAALSAPPAPDAPPTRREPAVNPEHTVEPPPITAPSGELVAAAGAAEPAPDVPVGATELAPPAPVEPALASAAEPAAPASAEPAAPAKERPPVSDGPDIEAVEIDVDRSRADKLRGIIGPPSTPPPPSSPEVGTIPRPRGRAPRMVSLTLLDGTTINLPAKRRPRPAVTGAEPAQPSEPAHPSSAPEAGASDAPPAGGSDLPAAFDSFHGLTARDLVLALRVVAAGADASEVLGENIRWESLVSALLSLMLKKHIIADWEFIEELKKQL